MAFSDELTDQFRGGVAALLDVKPDEIEDIEPTGYRVKVTRRTYGDGDVVTMTETRYHHIELS